MYKMKQYPNRTDLIGFETLEWNMRKGVNSLIILKIFLF